jgi:DNA-binding SARP family transcriptional activator
MNGEAMVRDAALGAPRPAEELGAAADAGDLVPGSVERMAALAAGLAQQHTGLDDTTGALARLTGGLDWSGAAADAFAAHRRAVLARADEWAHAAGLVTAALADHQHALAHARDRAAAALQLWRQAHQHAGHYLDTAAPGTASGAGLAANTEAVRHYVHAAVAGARHRAVTWLEQARAGLAASGDATARAITEAHDVLAGADLPGLHQLTTDAPGPGIPAGPGERTETVGPPRDGVHDSLWRIAGRTLGDPRRWPEIYHLNAGRVVDATGARLLNPHDLQPGWTLHIPTPDPPPVGVVPAPPTPAPIPGMPGIAPTDQPVPPAASSPAPATPMPGTPAPGAPAPGTPLGPHSPTPPLTHATPAPVPALPHASPPLPTPPGAPPAVPAPMTHTTGHGVSLGGGVVLAGGVVAALAVLATAAGLTGRRATAHGNTTRGPASGPVVRALTGTTSPAPADPNRPPGHTPGDPPDRDTPTATTDMTGATGTMEPTALPLGYHDDQTVLYDTAATLGLGLTGPGAPDAARALLISTLARHPDATAVLPAPDLAALLATGAPPRRGSGRITIAADLDAALAGLEADLLTRLRLLEDSHGQASPPPLVLITTAPTATGRLQAIADLGAGLGIVVIVIGHWPSGLTCHIDAAGTLRTTTDHPGWNITGLRAFTAPAADLNTLLDLLRTPPPPTAPTSTATATGIAGPPRTRSATTGPDTPDPTDPPLRPGYIQQRLAGIDPDTPNASETATNGNGTAAGPSLGDTHEQAAGLGVDRRGRAGRDRAVPVVDTELEVTAAAPSPATVDGGGGIPGPRRAAAPGARPRSPAAAHPRPAAGGEAVPGEVEDTPATCVADVEADTATALITITVLGALRVHWHPEQSQEREITGALQPRTQELLVLLALHPGGTTRDTLVAALWGDNPPTRPTNALHTALSRLRRDLATATGGEVADIALADHGHYRLDPATVRVDYWLFDTAVAARRAAATDSERIAAYRQVVNSYGGPLADGMAKVEWIEPAREAIRRDAIDAVSGLARALVDHDPQQTLDLLEVARAFDPHNELLYRDIMRLQERLGQLDAIPRTLALLSTRLTEIHEQPTPQARGLAARLGQRRDHDPADRPTSPGRPATGDQRGRSAAS